MVEYKDGPGGGWFINDEPASLNEAYSRLAEAMFGNRGAAASALNAKYKAATGKDLQYSPPESDKVAETGETEEISDLKINVLLERVLPKIHMMNVMNVYVYNIVFDAGGCHVRLARSEKNLSIDITLDY